MGVARLLTPSGETWTRRSEISAATSAMTGTPSTIAAYSQAAGVTVDAKYCVPISAPSATSGCRISQITVPRTAPKNALTAASTAAIFLMSAGVPPTSRSAANRSSRRLAASRVAVLISTSIGNRTASRPMANAYRKNGVNTSGAGAVAIEVTHTVPPIAFTAVGVYPM